jgi:hypothetical protein
LKIEDDRNAPNKMLKPENNMPRDDRFSHQQPKRPFERENIPVRQGLAGHDIFIPAPRPRSEPFPRERDHGGRDPRDVRGDGRAGFYPGETDSRPINNKKIQGYQDQFGERDRPLPYTLNQQAIDMRERDRVPDRLPERMPPPRYPDGGIGNRQDINRRVPISERLAERSRQLELSAERDRYMPDNFHDRPPMNDDPYRPVRRDIDDRDPRAMPRADFNRGGMNRPNEMPESEAARNMRLHRGNVRNVADFPPRGRELPPLVMRDIPPRDALRGNMMANDFDMGAGREAFASRFRERVEMKTGGMLERDAWQGGRGNGLLPRDDLQPRGNNAYPPQNDVRGNNQLAVFRPPFVDHDRNMPRGADEFQRGPDFGRSGLRDPVRPQFNNNNGPAVHPFASRVNSFAERNNAAFEPSIEDKRRDLRGPLPTGNFRNNNNNFNNNNNNNNNNRDGHNNPLIHVIETK